MRVPGVGVSIAPAPVVREGGLRVVVAANSFAPSNRRGRNLSRAGAGYKPALATKVAVRAKRPRDRSGADDALTTSRRFALPWMRPRMPSPSPGPAMLIDEWMPAYDVSERHE